MVELNRRRSRSRLWLGIALTVVVATAGFFLAAPQVTSFSPAPGAENVPRSSSIEIEFDQPMDRASVESRLSIKPALTGEFRWNGSRMQFTPREPWPEGSEVTVRLGAGARNTYFLPLAGGENWSFTVAPAQVLYLAPAEGPARLIGHPLREAFGQPLPEPSAEIADYDVARAAGILAYLQADAEGVFSLYHHDLATGERTEVYECPVGVRCLQVAVSPDGSWVALVRRETAESDTGVRQLTARRVWVMGTRPDAEPVPLGREGAESHSPAWAAQNQLGYYDADRGVVAVVERESDGTWEEVSAVPHPLGERWSWSPDGRFVVFPEVELLEDSPVKGVDFYGHLYRVEIETGLRTDLSGGLGDLVEDAAPAYSPDGLWIAFARKSLRPEEWTPGRQLWLMRSDGTQSRQLTDDPNYNHAEITWNASGSRLAYVRFLQVELDRPPEVWWMDLESEEQSLLVEGAYAPQWMP